MTALQMTVLRMTALRNRAGHRSRTGIRHAHPGDSRNASLAVSRSNSPDRSLVGRRSNRLLVMRRPGPPGRHGLQLIEVLVGTCIMAVVGIAVLTALTQSAKETQTISDFTLAFLISQKVVEETIESTYENSHADRALEALSGAKGAIKERGHPFFEAVEDSDPPYGRLIQPDLSVDSRDPNLFRLYREYQMSLIVTDETIPELPGNPKLLENVTVKLDWPGLDPNRRSFDFPVTIAKPIIVPRPMPVVASDIAGLDRLIKEALYPSFPGTDLTAAVNAAGGQLTVVRDLGTVLVVLSSAQDQLNELDDQIVDAQAAANAPSWPNLVRQAAARSLVARLHEKKATTILQALLYCREPAWRVSSSFQGSSLGTAPKPERASVYGLLTLGMRYPLSLGMAARAALDKYLWARSVLPALGPAPFWQFCLERKILELAKVTNLLQADRNVSFLASWINYLMEIYRNRNRFVQDYLERERVVCRDLDSIEANHAEMKKRLAEVIEAQKALTDLRARIATELP